MRRTSGIGLAAVALGIGAALFMSEGCRHEVGVVPVASPSPTPTPTPGTDSTGNTGNDVPDTSLCFERDVLPIFTSNCAMSGCHDAATAKDGYVFTSYATITAKKFTPGDPEDTELYEKITEDDPDDIMPPPPRQPLTAGQIAVIYDWINRGAPNSSGCAPAGCDTAVFTYSGAVQPILQNNCTGCHSGPAPSGGIALNTHAGAAAAASSGRLLGAVRHTAGFSPMPQGGARLSNCRIRQIEKWIAAGTPNN